MPTTMIKHADPEENLEVPTDPPLVEVATPVLVAPVVPQVIRPAAPKFTFSLKRASEHENWIKMLVYGAYGSGKSYFAGTSADVPEMRDVLYLDLEAGSMTIANRGDNIDIIPIKNFQDLEQVKQYLTLHCQRRDRGDVEGMRSLEEQLRGEKVETPKRYKTVIFDSMSEANKVLMAYLLNATPETSGLDSQIEDAQFSHWGQAALNMLRVVRAFRALPIHTIFVASDKTKEDERKQQKILLNLSGQLANDVQGFFDVVGFLVNLASADGTQARRMFLQPGTWGGAAFNAKHRFSGINVPYLDDPAVADIYQLLQMMKEKI